MATKITNPIPQKDPNKPNVAVSFAAYQYQEDYVTPVNRKLKGRDIQLWGSDNNYPKFLHTLYNNSSTHASIVDGKLDYIAGQNIISKTGKNKKLAAFIEKCNSHGDTLYDLYRKLALDDLIYGGFAFQIVYTRGGDIYELNYVDISTLRYNELATKVKKAERAEDWWNMSNTYGGKSIKIVEYPLYDPNVTKGEQIFVYSGLSTKDIYPRETYRPAITHIRSDIEMGNYNLSQITNNITPSIIIQFPNGVPSIEEQETIERSLKAKFGSTKNTSGAFLLFSEPGEQEIKVTVVEDGQSSQKYINAAESTANKIYAAHRANPSLFGIQQAGKLGDNQQLKVSYQVFKSQVIEPKQRELISVFNKVLSPSFKNCDLQVVQLPPLNIVFQEERLIASCMTVDEMRNNLQSWGWIANAKLADGEQVIGDKNQPNLNNLDNANAAKAQAGADALTEPDDEDDEDDNEDQDNNLQKN